MYDRTAALIRALSQQPTTPKPVVQVGTIGHVDHHKTTLMAALMKAAQLQQPATPAKGGAKPVAWMVTAGEGYERHVILPEAEAKRIHAELVENGWQDARIVALYTTPPATPAGGGDGGTPSSRWAANGEPDPHGNTYDCERAELTMGDFTDDELANAVFLHGNERPSLADMGAGRLPAIAYLMAAKDRIRWLSRRLASTGSTAEPVSSYIDRLGERIERGMSDVERFGVHGSHGKYMHDLAVEAKDYARDMHASPAPSGEDDDDSDREPCPCCFIKACNGECVGDL